jgi:hypothetical protein
MGAVDVEAPPETFVEVSFSQVPGLVWVLTLWANLRGYVADVRHTSNGRRNAICTVVATLLAQMILSCFTERLSDGMNWLFYKASLLQQACIGGPFIDMVHGMSTGRKFLIGRAVGVVRDNLQFAGQAAPLSLGAASRTDLLEDGLASRDHDE